MKILSYQYPIKLGIKVLLNPFHPGYRCMSLWQTEKIKMNIQGQNTPFYRKFDQKPLKIQNKLHVSQTYCINVHVYGMLHQIEKGDMFALF